MAGRGRGRFRGRGGRLPFRGDEDGKLAAAAKLPPEPPPIYPPVDNMPPKVTPQPDMEQLVEKYHQFSKYWRNSVFYMSQGDASAAAGSEGSGGAGAKQHAPELQLHAGGQQPVETRPRRQRLEAVLTLHPKYFPPELHGKRAQQSSSSVAGLQAAYWRQRQQRDADDGGLARLDELAKVEKATTAAPDAAAAAEDAEDEEEEEEEIDEDYDDNDYLQNEYFDDDEGYEDFDDGGGDDAIM